ncbi:peptidase inhibitor family I36 protein [Streptomyces sp. I05A-00742]|uniref:peptidase inhibitor family I36 protein n=1 Tax=Streptomyces sp. I05A-00742 TaxID=2732853 RepID=UPI00148785A6|nr:peptidase inhibitor family I36 protein [Streptomyces sp. I05A-00742]
MLRRLASTALGAALAVAGTVGFTAPALADGVAHDQCTAGNICFWSEPGFKGEKTVYKSALIECTRIIKPSQDAPERRMTARSMKNRTERTIVLGYNDPLCLLPNSTTLSQTPLHLSPLSDNADMGEGIQYIRTT